MEREIAEIERNLDAARGATTALRAALDDAPAPALLGTAEVAALVGWKPSSISAALNRGQLPTPYARLACGPIWTRQQIETWQEGRAS